MRNQRVLIVVFLIIGMVLFGCNFLQRAVTTEKPGTNTAGLTGMWESQEWGQTQLTQEGNKVRGTYIYHDGQIEGTINGQRIEFRWWEGVAIGQPYESADPASRGDGYFDVSKDGKTLTGKWRYEGSSEWSGDWNMTRK
jgi:hypothetical protein